MDPDRYVSLEELHEEIVYAPRSFNLEESEYDTLLTRLLDEESERIESDVFAGRTWGLDSSPDDAAVPGPVKDGVVRLVRSRLDRIQADGVESESLSSGQSASFRPAAEIRRDVRQTVSEYRPKGNTESSFGAWTV